MVDRGTEEMCNRNQRRPASRMQKGYISFNLQLHRKDIEPGKIQKKTETIQIVISCPIFLLELLALGAF